MTPQRLGELAKAMGASAPKELAGAGVSGVATDSRVVREGQLYFALAGRRFDGHDFVAASLKAGAVAAVVSRPGDLPTPLPDRLLVVSDTLAALQRLAWWYRGRFRGRVIAVTGSNGKTTTKEMLGHLLGAVLKGRVAPQSFNNHVGVPLTLLSGEQEDDYLVVEVGSNHPGEIAMLAGLVRPDLAVITGVGPTHLEGFGSEQAVAVEKASLLDHLAEGGKAVVNVDNPAIDGALSGRVTPIIRYGESRRADVMITDVHTAEGGVNFQFRGRRYRLPVLGRHNALNAAAAMIVAMELGVPAEALAERWAGFRLPAMRLETTQVGEVTVINDAYNANPASMRAALAVLVEVAAGRRRVLVCGDMKELGAESARWHRQLGRGAVEAGVQALLAVGDLAGEVVDGAIEAGLRRERAHRCRTVQEAGEVLPGLLDEGDVVLIKGSRAMELERLVEVVPQAGSNR